MAIPMAESFLCRKRKASPTDIAATDGQYYLSPGQLNFEGEQSPALILFWAPGKTAMEGDCWRSSR